MPTLSSTVGEFGFEPQSTTPATSSSTDGPPQNVTANPSLILAFLALSFFTMAMIFIFGFRRYQYFQERFHEVFGRPGADPNRPSEQQAAGETIRLRGLLGTKPKLWEVCTDTSVRWWEAKTTGITGTRRRARGGDSDALWGWDNVMPLSASKVVNPDEVGKVPVCRSHNPASSNVFQRFWRSRARTTTTPIPRSSDMKRPKSMTSFSPPMTRLRLAVLVAMPSERYPIYDRELREDRSRHERGMLGYELGLHELPATWDEYAK